MRRRQLGTVALVAALALGAAGCGEDSPKPGPVAESSGNQSSSVSDAEDFTQAFIKALNSGSVNLDTTEWRGMFSSQCLYCERVADQIDTIKKQGGSFEADPWTIKSIKVTTSSNGFTAIARVRIPPQQVRYSAGGRVEKTTGQDDALQQLELKQVPGGLTAIKFGPVNS